MAKAQILRHYCFDIYVKSEAEFKEFKPRLKYGWFHLKLYKIFQGFKLALNWNRFLGDLRRGLNSLNSDTGLVSSNKTLTKKFSNENV